MSNFGVIAKLAGPSSKGAPVVSVGLDELRIRSIQFCDESMWEGGFFHLYRTSSSHAQLNGKQLDGWSKGAKIDEPEWVADRKEANNYRACFRRGGPLACTVVVVARTRQKGLPTRDLRGTLTVAPTLKGLKSGLQAVNESFTYPAGASSHKLHIVLEGGLPDEIGRYDLQLKWALKSNDMKLTGARRTRHRIYTAFGRPLDPAHEVKNKHARVHQGIRSADHFKMLNEAAADLADGTVTGTRKRLDYLMKLIEEKGKPYRHAAENDEDLVDLFWKLHVGLNNPTPPRFFGENATAISVDPFGKGDDLPLADQWLALLKVNNPKKRGGRWNNVSCAGHVQLAKTMLASVGLLVRPTWVYPKTWALPDGEITLLGEPDLYTVGQYDANHAQWWEFEHNGRTYKAQPLLMQADTSWEYYEACMLSPEGHFLTGGFHTNKNPRSFRKNRGFKSAKELLRWWANIKHKGWGQRFMCWVYYKEGADDSQRGEGHCWDVEGKHYDLDDYEQIRRNGKQLPLP